MRNTLLSTVLVAVVGCSSSTTQPPADLIDSGNTVPKDSGSESKSDTGDNVMPDSGSKADGGATDGSAADSGDPDGPEFALG